MAKRPTVDVDEEYLKEIMAGGVNRLQKRELPKPEAEQSNQTVELPKQAAQQPKQMEELPKQTGEQPKQTGHQPKQPSEKPSDSSETPQLVKEEKGASLQVESKESGKPVRKKREAQDYESLFLERKASVARRQTYISAQLYEKINSFLTVIAGHPFNITLYINNILTNHLEQYREDINELYERKTQKPF